MLQTKEFGRSELIGVPMARPAQPREYQVRTRVSKHRIQLPVLRAIDSPSPSSFAADYVLQRDEYAYQGPAVFLATDADSSYVTGAIINVTGKHSAFLTGPKSTRPEAAAASSPLSLHDSQTWL